MITMTENNIKRQFTPELDFDDGDLDLKRQELDSSKKSTTKPGRKPIETEPKNKRTAQNRAAQRAFRERKERKMKELEDKVSMLEDEKKSMSTESEFLRMQVQMLMSELAKHRGSPDLSDLKLPSMTSSAPPSLRNSEGSVSSNSSAPSTIESSTPDSATAAAASFSFEFPWGRKNSTGKSPLQINSPAGLPSSGSGNITNPGLTSDCSTTSSNSSSPFEFTNRDENNLISFPTKPKTPSSTTNNAFKFDDHFDEGISDFCVDLNSACGTKACPAPQSKNNSRVSTPAVMNSSAVTNNEPGFFIKQELDQHISNLEGSNQPLSFLGTDFTTPVSFDQSLAFGARDDGIFGFFDVDNEIENPVEEDPLKNLTTEESRYDPFGLFENIPLATPSSTSSYSHTPRSNAPAQEKSTPYPAPQTTTRTTTSNAKEDLTTSILNELVPNKESRLLKCTEIWDRVTSHPRYSDIDIDGLCAELRAKAKCSDKGVVIDCEDVKRVINNSLQ